MHTACTPVFFWCSDVKQLRLRVTANTSHGVFTVTDLASRVVHQP